MNVINVSSQWSEKADFMVEGVTLLSRQGLRYHPVGFVNIRGFLKQRAASEKQEITVTKRAC